jgi:hypothetical protein
MIVLNEVTAPAAGPQEEEVVLSEQHEQVLYEIARSMGFLVHQEEADALLSVMTDAEARGAQALTEVKSIVRLNRQAKLDGLIMHSALVIAQHQHDPLFQKYAQAAEVKRRIRGIIVRKYNAKAQQTARKLLANAGKVNMVDVASSKAFNKDDHHSEVPVNPGQGKGREGPAVPVKPIHTVTPGEHQK